MCMDEECKLKENCYRNPASGTKPSQRQAVFLNIVYRDDSCDYYWPVGEKK